jgi:hypothetical protein
VRSLRSPPLRQNHPRTRLHGVRAEESLAPTGAPAQHLGPRRHARLGGDSGQTCPGIVSQQPSRGLDDHAQTPRGVRPSAMRLGHSRTLRTAPTGPATRPTQRCQHTSGIQQGKKVRSQRRARVWTIAAALLAITRQDAPSGPRLGPGPVTGSTPEWWRPTSHQWRNVGSTTGGDGIWFSALDRSSVRSATTAGASPTATSRAATGRGSACTRWTP